MQTGLILLRKVESSSGGAGMLRVSRAETGKLL